MHAPNRATQVIPPARIDPAPDAENKFYPGFCRSGCPANGGEGGWFVPYRRARQYSDAYDAIINLYVHDLSSNFTCGVNFVIDTGTDVTIIPRHLMKPSNAFEAGKSRDTYHVNGLTGGSVVGLRFKASLYVPTPHPDIPPLVFTKLKVAVVEARTWDYAMLGLDALRQVVMVSDRDHVSLWPAPSRACQSA